MVGVNRDHPLRPVVEIFYDSRGSRLAEPKLVDLVEHPFQYVVAPLAEHEIRAYAGS